MRVAYRIATTTSDSGGTWSNATELVLQIYRPTSGNQAAIGANAGLSGSSTTLTYSALTLQDTSGASWVAAFGQSKTSGVGLSSMPSGLTQRQDEVGTGELVGGDTNGGVSSWSAHTDTITTSVWKAFAIEIKDVTPPGGDAWSNVPCFGGFTFTNSFKTATGLNNNDACVSVTNHTSGKQYFETTAIGGVHDGGDHFGLRDDIGASANHCNWTSDGTVDDSFGGVLGTIQVWNSGDTLGFAIDIDHSLIWFKNITQSSNWNNSGTANPATGVGGFTFSINVSAGGWIVFWSTNDNGATLNTGTSTFAGSVPSGFSAWFSGSGPVTNPVSLSITASATVSAIKSAARKLAVTSASTISNLKSVGKPLAFSSASAVSSTLMKLKNVLVSFTSGSTLTLVNQTGKNIIVPAGSILSQQKVVGKVLAVSASSVLTLLKQMSRAFSFVSTSAISVLKLWPKTLSFSSSSLVTRANSVSKLLQVAAPGAVSLVKQISKPLAITSASIASIIAIKARSVLLAITSSSTVTVSKNVVKQLSIASAGIVAVVRAVTKTLSFNATSAVSVLRQLGKILPILSASIVSVLAIKARSVVLAITAASTVSVTKSVAKPLAIVSASVVAVVRSFGKVLLATSSAISLVLLKQVSKSFSVTGASTVSIIAIKAKTVFLAITSASSITLSKAITKPLLIGVLSATTLLKQVNKPLSFTSASVVSATAGRLFIRVLNVVSASAVSVKRGYTKTLQVVSGSSLSMSRAISKILQIESISRLIISIASSVRSSAGAPRRVLGRITRYFVTGSLEIQRITGSINMDQHEPLDFLCNTDWQLGGPLTDGLGNVLSLAGATLTWKLDSLDGGTNFITLTGSPAIAITDNATSTVLVDVPTAETGPLPPGTYRDYLYVTTSGGAFLPLWSGLIRAKAAPA